MSWIEKLTGSLEQKKQYKQAIARMEALPAPYRDAAMAYHRYFMYSAGFLDGDTMVTLFADFADLWDRAAADATPLRDIVGADPVEFGEEFVKAYSGRQWIDKERTRLTDAIAKAEREQS
ncbi:MAG: DUF1048 domain-containing protein [Microbacterium sp.]|uniref:DUF1048 domain-containing protein n=1 Tax=Microbacterium sp. TaxID=51671 RepID=UPI001AC73B19|nr:DUF1048 domain-containing protein [Microbacterium sp.]MBN9176790.1 DUF1048 domain-containing protein [Microbacterium sp.]